MIALFSIKFALHSTVKSKILLNLKMKIKNTLRRGDNFEAVKRKN